MSKTKEALYEEQKQNLELIDMGYQEFKQAVVIFEEKLKGSIDLSEEAVMKLTKLLNS